MAARKKPVKQEPTKAGLEFVPTRYAVLHSGRWVGSLEQIPGTADEWHYFLSGTAMGLGEERSINGRAPSEQMAWELARAVMLEKSKPAPKKARKPKK